MIFDVWERVMMDRTVEIRMVTVNDMPDSLAGCCSKRKDGTFLILINGRMSEEAQEMAAAHEFRHIWNDDHESSYELSSIGEYRYPLSF